MAARRGEGGAWEGGSGEIEPVTPQSPLDPGLIALYVAQLTDAREVLTEYRRTKRVTRQVWRDYRWVSHDGDEWPFSFRVCCFALGLNPQSVRDRFRDEGLITEALAVKVWRIEHPRRPKKKRRRRQGLSAPTALNSAS